MLTSTLQSNTICERTAKKLHRYVEYEVTKLQTIVTFDIPASQWNHDKISDIKLGNILKIYEQCKGQIENSAPKRFSYDTSLQYTVNWDYLGQLGLSGSFSSLIFP